MRVASRLPDGSTPTRLRRWLRGSLVADHHLESGVNKLVCVDMSMAEFYIENGIDPSDPDHMDNFLAGMDEEQSYGHRGVNETQAPVVEDSSLYNVAQHPVTAPNAADGDGGGGTDGSGRSPVAQQQRKEAA